MRPVKSLVCWELTERGKRLCYGSSVPFLNPLGTARVAGHSVLDEPERVRQKIGFVSNNTAIYDRMSAVEMVQHFGQLHGLSREEVRARTELLFRQLRMKDFRDVLGAKMSTGMQQKVSIARALIHDPPVLIFDEATLGLDVLVARNLLQIIRELREAGKCLIFSTHIMSEVERLCDRIAIMHQGRILDTGRLTELRDRPRSMTLAVLFPAQQAREQAPERKPSQRTKPSLLPSPCRREELRESANHER